MRFEEALKANEALKVLGIRHRGRAAELMGALGLNIGQEQLLLELDRNGPSTQTHLAVAARCEPPTITIAVRKLEAAGIVARAQSASDARVIVVRLTEAGQALMPQVRSAWRQLAETVKGMSTDERAMLAAFLAQMIDNLESGSTRRKSRRPKAKALDSGGGGH
jgi:DNA-binding MarR family transcriptional regulator